MVETPHERESPFPALIPAGTVLDERCTCEHVRSEHLDTVAYGHGRCYHAECGCAKYTWKSFILKPT